MKSCRFFLAASLVLICLALSSADAEDPFIPPSADGTCNDTFDPDAVDEETWNTYAPVACTPVSAPLFADAGPHDVFEFELQADFDVINDLSIPSTEMDRASSRGTLRYTDAASGDLVEIPITLEARGKSRYSHCAFRPLRIVFDDHQTGNIFEGASKKVKVVTHCGNHPVDPWILGGTPEEQRQRLLAEYYFYQVLEKLDSTALATRLAYITYRDDDGSVVATEYAFLREREDDACQRCGFVDEVEDDDTLTPDPTSLFQAHLYNHFVYNNDYIPESGHNTRRCKDADLNGFYIPYDWDLTGVIRPDYSRNQGISYADNLQSFWNWLNSETPAVQTQIQAWHLVENDEAMREVLQESLLDAGGRELMQGWYSLYMCALRCYLGIGASIEILEPTGSSPSTLQPTDGSGRMLIRIEYQPVNLIPDNDDFEVEIGGVEAPVISGARVASQYWLVVQTPSGISGRSDLRVRFRMCALDAVDSEADAVAFGNPDDSDTVLVIDTSGSMNDDRKIESAINAAVLFINTLRDSERIGVIEYSGELASGYGRTAEIFSIDPADGNRAAAETEVRNLSAGNNTPLGSGLLRGLEELDSVAEAERNDVRSLILLSDGKENVPNFWAEPPDWYLSPPNPPNTPVIDTFDAAQNSGIRVHTVSLGPDADPVLMEAISAGRGTYRHADVIPAAGSDSSALDPPFTLPVAYAASSDDIVTSELPLRLSNLYEHLHNATSNQERLFQKVQRTRSGGADPPTAAVSETPFTISGADFIPLQIESGLSYATITISWTKAALKELPIIPPPDQDPTRIQVTKSRTNSVYRITQPKAGDWRIQVPAQSTGEKLFVTLSGVSTQKGFVRAISSQLPGDPISVVCVLAGEQAVLNAAVSAGVYSAGKRLGDIQLFDDGSGDDAKADDGFYSGRFAETAQGGTYEFEFNVTWTGADGIQRSRVYPLAVALPPLDSDRDGISDADEIRFGLDPHNNADGGSDPDRDGLPTWKEILIGLDPFKTDSDGGGAPDGIEVASGTNPENPGDDAGLKKDSDRDGLPDAWETAFGLNPNDPADATRDQDGDGLLNRLEYQYGTSPVNRDTDGDQVPDGKELEAKTDPSDPTNRIESYTPPDEPPQMQPESNFAYLLTIIVLFLILILFLFIFVRK